MSSLRGTVAVLRTGTSLLRRGPQRIIKRQGSDESHIGPRYRQIPHVTRSQKFMSEFICGTMWFWILWHCWHSPEDVLGHFPWPDPSEWTDEELGIPPDDED